MQETTFNSPYHASVHHWLDALYAGSSQKISLEKSDIDQLAHFNSVRRLENLLNYSFKNKELLIAALTQSTFCYEFKDLRLSNNERLEFLGDSLVNLIVAKILFEKFPEEQEGRLSKLRGALVNEQSFAKLAGAISLGENLLLGKGEHKNQGQYKESLLADAFEALAAAIYLDSNKNFEVLEACFAKIISVFEEKSGRAYFTLNKLEQFDSKTQLQELAMQLFQTHPTYKSVDIENGFHVELWINDKKCAEGDGPSKKKLEKELARLVLDEKRYQ